MSRSVVNAAIVAAEMPDEPLRIRLAAIGSCDHITVTRTGPTVPSLPPVTVIIQGHGGFVFQDYLTADEAEELGDALTAVALYVREQARAEG